MAAVIAAKTEAFMKKFLSRLKGPSRGMIAAAWCAFACVLSGVLTLLILNPEGVFITVLSYILYPISAVLFGYCVYTVVYAVNKGVKTAADKNRKVHRFVYDYEFRTILLAIGSFLISVCVSIFNGTLALLGSSVWYGALAVYYILLASLRGCVLIGRRKGRKLGENEIQMEYRDAKAYLTSGILLICLTLALSGALVQMVRDKRAFLYAGTMIYVAAAYAFYKIIMSIVNLFKARKADDYAVQAIRNINFADALVSILALQTALLQTFSKEESAVNTGMFHSVTGAVVAAVIIVMGILMIVQGKRKIKEIGKIIK